MPECRRCGKKASHMVADDWFCTAGCYNDWEYERRVAGAVSRLCDENEGDRDFSSIFEDVEIILDDHERLQGKYECQCNCGVRIAKSNAFVNVSDEGAPFWACEGCHKVQTEDAATRSLRKISEGSMTVGDVIRVDHEFNRLRDTYEGNCERCNERFPKTELYTNLKGVDECEGCRNIRWKAESDDA